MTAPRVKVIALHGFLGSPSDWDGLAAAWPEADWDAVDLWELFSSRGVSGWAAVGAALDARLRASLGHGDLPVFVVGYSLGARLALSVPDLGQADSPFAGTCLVSCDPGWPDADDGARAVRRASDEAWAQRFIDAPVGRIWQEWDAQPVFGGSAVPRRGDRLPAPRVAIARAMRVASLASQPDRRPLLRSWMKPLLWVAGERDQKFKAIADSLARDGVPARFFTCEHAGHRVPWDNPGLFLRTLQEWIASLLQSGRP